MKPRFVHNFQDIVSIENILLAWQDFVSGKRSKKDVQEFNSNLIDNIVGLHESLVRRAYRHGPYRAFNINDPKPRSIHKATVRDRLLHHAIYRKLYPFFDKTFVADSFSCRIGKGTHKAGLRFRRFINKVSQNNTHTCWILKCDIKKFFASIDQNILIQILRSYIPDSDIIWLLERIIYSFSASKPRIGLPLGNLTSQLFINIYMNEFDQFVKHTLKIKYYVRYADDFVILSHDKNYLEDVLSKMVAFLKHKLKLDLHPNKIYIKTIASGVDFLGWIYFPDHKVLRSTTKRRMMARIKEHNTNETVQSYLGLLKHGNTKKTKQELLNNVWLWHEHQIAETSDID